MLSCKKQTFGLKEKLIQIIPNPHFVVQKNIWEKRNSLPNPCEEGAIHSRSFIKYGKTLCFEVKRYFEFKAGTIFYYKEEDSPTYSGYCQTKNLYMSVQRMKQKNVICLTNGFDLTELHFADKNSFRTLKTQISKFTVQINCQQKYVINKKIGKGAFSQVYYGEKRKDRQKKFAFKVVDKDCDCIQKSERIRSFVKDEKNVLQKLNSPYLSKMKEFFEEDEAFVFVLEYIPGLNLNNFMKKYEDIPKQAKVIILRDIAKGLQDMHTNNIVHRDLKPPNIMIDVENLSAKIIDFGLSTFVNGKSQIKELRCGTVGFMAPEVINNRISSQNLTKSDIFSLGILFHLVLMGKNPLRGKNYIETQKNNKEVRMNVDRKSISAKYGDDAASLLQRMLEKDPDVRIGIKEVVQSAFLCQKVENVEKISLKAIEEEENCNIYSEEEDVDEKQSPLKRRR